MTLSLRDRFWPLLGRALIACGLVILFIPVPKEYGPWHCLTFISCWSVGAWLTMGLIGTHPEAARRRRLAAASPPASMSASTNVPKRVFYYGRNFVGRSLASVFCILLGLGFAAGALFFFFAPGTPLPVRGICGGMFLLFGLFLCYYGHRYLTVQIQTDSHGIVARLYLRTIRMRWADVVALVKRELPMPAVVATDFGAVPGSFSAGTVCYVYSNSDKIWFSGCIVGAAELDRIVREATGLSWSD